MAADFALGKRRVGPDEPPLVIAEVGINHEGSVDKAIALADAAIGAGAECVKFQCHITPAEMLETDMRPGKISEERLWDIIRRCELTEAEERRLKSYCEQKGVIYLCTPFSREAADRLESMDVVGFKIGSGECNHIPLLKHVARKGRPMILSTGMNDMASIRAAVEAIRSVGCPLMLLHCTSTYPSRYAQMRLGAIAELREAFGLQVGLSDHSPNVYTCLGAVALGAVALEKHFTVSRSWPGPDVPLSIEPHELAELVRGSRAIWEARGGRKGILPEEQPVIDFAYATAVTVKPIARGETFTPENAWAKRPGTGPIHAREMEARVFGRRAARDLKADVQIAWDDVAD